jgi:hypothetical protein
VKALVRRMECRAVMKQRARMRTKIGTRRRRRRVASPIARRGRRARLVTPASRPLSLTRGLDFSRFASATIVRFVRRRLLIVVARECLPRKSRVTSFPYTYIYLRLFFPFLSFIFQFDNLRRAKHTTRVVLDVLNAARESGCCKL